MSTTPGEQNQPPAYPGDGYQQPYPQQPGYDYQQPYGQPGYGGRTPHMERPGIVTAAAIITFVASALAALGGVLFGILLGPSWEDGSFRESLIEDMTPADVRSLDANHGLYAGFSWTVLVLAVVAIVVAVFVLRGSKAARVVLTVLSGITVVVGLVSLVWSIAAVLVIVFLYVGRAGEWFAFKADQRRAG